MNARDLLRGDRFSMNVPLKVLSITPLAEGRVLIKAETENPPSVEFGDAGCVLEIVCKGYRPFAARWRGRGGGGGGGGGEDDPLPPANPELVHGE